MTQLTYSESNVLESIYIKSKSVTEIKLSWEKQNETKVNGASLHYLLKIRKGMKVSEMRIKKERISLPNLEMCSKYCFHLSSVNKAGFSELSKEICCYTLAPSKIE